MPWTRAATRLLRVTTARTWAGHSSNAVQVVSLYSGLHGLKLDDDQHYHRPPAIGPLGNHGVLFGKVLLGCPVFLEH
ncbi:hypothetical protein CSHISOI_09931 [Colletotrichum shisoi]|uniref:Uncharacterized protein n=1 Tax=Colletotrichum shisoi TaxID=2078593 RepID=A0A5Q4BFK3_9PEZI|nr:hypothetical protein CSHISOI_09931 [Colletotrichum shisoi]